MAREHTYRMGAAWRPMGASGFRPPQSGGGGASKNGKGVFAPRVTPKERMPSRAGAGDGIRPLRRKGANRCALRAPDPRMEIAAPSAKKGRDWGGARAFFPYRRGLAPDGRIRIPPSASRRRGSEPMRASRARSSHGDRSSKRKKRTRLRPFLRWSCYPDSDRRPHAYQACALPAEL